MTNCHSTGHVSFLDIPIVWGNFYLQTFQGFVFFYLTSSISFSLLILPQGKASLLPESICINHVDVFTMMYAPACLMFMLHRLPVYCILVNIHDSFYIWSWLTPLVVCTMLKNSPSSYNITMHAHIVHAVILIQKVFVFACIFVYLCVCLHSLHIAGTSCAFITVCVWHFLFTCCVHAAIVNVRALPPWACKFACVCRPVYSLCTRA